MDPFTHLYLDTEDIEDAATAARGIHDLVSETPLEIQTESLSQGVRFPYAVSQNVNLRYDRQNRRLHVEVEGGQNPTTRRKATTVFDQIAKYVRQTREWGTYEIAPEVGLGEQLVRLIQRWKEVFGFSR